MRIYLQGLSALSYYRNGGSATEVERCAVEIRALSDAVSSRAALADADIWRLGIDEPSEQHPVEVLVRDGKQRTRSRAVRARVWKGPIAPTGFRTAGKNIYVSSPEFIFLQMATRLDLPELVALGMELCGTYRLNVRLPHIDSDETDSVTVYQQPEISTPKRLLGFLQTMRSAPGRARACKALQYVLPHSASPAETSLYLLLCLPRRLGGYALPKPILNPSITVSKSGRKHTLRHSAKPDLYWKKARLDLEYNSDEFHDEHQRALDSMRRKALERMKVEVIELTSDEFYSTDLFHATALRIGRCLNKRIRSEHEGAFVEKRLALRSALLKDQSATSGTHREKEEASAYADRTTLEDNNAVNDQDIWLDWLPGDVSWASDIQEGDETWGVEITDADFEGIRVFGQGGREAE